MWHHPQPRVPRICGDLSPTRTRLNCEKKRKEKKITFQKSASVAFQRCGLSIFECLLLTVSLLVGVFDRVFEFWHRTWRRSGWWKFLPWWMVCWKTRWFFTTIGPRATATAAQVRNLNLNLRINLTWIFYWDKLQTMISVKLWQPTPWIWSPVHNFRHKELNPAENGQFSGSLAFGPTLKIVYTISHLPTVHWKRATPKTHHQPISKVIWAWNLHTIIVGRKVTTPFDFYDYLLGGRWGQLNMCCKSLSIHTYSMLGRDSNLALFLFLSGGQNQDSQTKLGTNLPPPPLLLSYGKQLQNIASMMRKLLIQHPARRE